MTFASTSPKAPRKAVASLEQTYGKGGMTIVSTLTLHVPRPMSLTSLASAPRWYGFSGHGL